MSPAALAYIEEEGQEIIRDIAIREPAKVISIRTGITPRHAYNLREDIGQPKLAWPYFIMLAKQYPQLRTKVLEWLEAETGDSGEDPQRLAAEIAAFLSQRGQR